jgi:hypothetical protein
VTRWSLGEGTSPRASPAAPDATIDKRRVHTLLP